MTIKLYLDKRTKSPQLKVGISKGATTAYINLEIRLDPSQWDPIKQKIKNHPNRDALQLFADNRMNLISNVIHRLREEGELIYFTPTQIKNRVLQEIDPNFDSKNTLYNRIIVFMEGHTSERTRDIYYQTAKKLLKYDRTAKTLTFEKVNKEWLTGFDRFMANEGLSVNARSIHMRNLRAVFNDAIDNDITHNYPFRRFKIKSEPTIKRSLAIDQLRDLFALQPSDVLSVRAIDYFKLVFFLIGINVADLYDLSEITRGGRIDYRRKKTGALYSIKVEPEALELIKKYRGNKKLLDLADRYAAVHNVTSKINQQLKFLGFGPITVYWARHSWATTAYELDIPNETIAAALGHSFGNKTTAIYINKDIRKIDEANRRVLDWVLYGKK